VTRLLDAALLAAVNVAILLAVGLAVARWWVLERRRAGERA
jgi:hypothetical protein